MKISKAKLRELLKSKYSMVLGELSLEELRIKVSRFPNIKVKISGRSYKTGKSKTVTVLSGDWRLA